ncbi:MAG: hypothetical protein AAFU64_14665 [Bacteroidota bacterium]
MSNKHFILSLFLLFLLSQTKSRGQSKLVSELPFEVQDAAMLREVVTWVNFKDSICYQGFLFQRSGLFLDSLLIRSLTLENTLEPKAGNKDWWISEGDFLDYVYYLEEKQRRRASGLLWLCLVF